MCTVMLLVHRLANTLRLCPQDLSSEGHGTCQDPSEDLTPKTNGMLWRLKKKGTEKIFMWNIMECLKILLYLMFFCIAKYFAKYCEWLKCHFFHALETLHPEPHTYTKSLLASNKEASRSKTTAYLTLT